MSFISTQFHFNINEDTFSPNFRIKEANKKVFPGDLLISTLMALLAISVYNTSCNKMSTLLWSVITWWQCNVASFTCIISVNICTGCSWIQTINQNLTLSQNYLVNTNLIKSKLKGEFYQIIFKILEFSIFIFIFL